jgi:hypothetical protein
MSSSQSGKIPVPKACGKLSAYIATQRETKKKINSTRKVLCISENKIKWDLSILAPEATETRTNQETETNRKLEVRLET